MACRKDFGQVASNALSIAAANSPEGAKKRLFLSAADFFKALNKIAPPPKFDGQQAPKRLRDAEFVRVAEWCAMYGKQEWSLRPRTFIVLHMIGCPEAVEEFVQQGYSDIALPYTAANLPKAVRGEKARRQFLDLQNYVLTAHAEHLEREGEPHQNVEGSADEYFITVKELGQGSFGQVDHVVGRLSIEHFARKRIPRGKSFKRDQQAIKSFQNELKSLKALSHRHLVKLISSYTDQNWVGLITKPVADCNFELFLSAEDIDQTDRQTCIRRFFGCLATAVSYLHQNQIRHKDIKPANILVKDRAVLLTDFGTSHNWSDDTRSTSNGTSVGFTKRYCAPEVAGCASRNQSSDVWSLGCVFLEMGTVLNNRTVYEMRSFFETHGSRGPYVRGNKEAATMWLEELGQSSKCVDDMQPLHLSQDMCNEDPDQRPTAALVVSEILDFQGEAPYCGHCCDSENGTLRPTDNELTERGHFLDNNDTEDSFQSLSIIEPTSDDSSTLVQTLPNMQDGQPIPSDIPQDHDQSLIEIKSNWRQPTVEDYEGTVTTFSPNSLSHSNSDAQEEADKDKIGPKTSYQFDLGNLRLGCEWPGCHETSNPKVSLIFDSRVELEQHYRSQHLVHEFGCSQTLATRESALSVASLATHSDSNVCRAFVLKNLLPPPATGQGIPVQLRSPSGSTQKISSTGLKPQATRLTTSEDSGQHVRFGMLPDNKRPEPTIQFREVEDVRSNYNYITPEPLEEPILPTNSRSKEENEKSRASTGLRIPKSSMVPSYFLAASNRFTRREIETLIPPARLSALVPPPLFVYGSLMFPSILRARAEQFIGAEGIYSETYQRRLKTDASDWSRINFSLQHAAEQMTPARLEGYDRFKLYGVNNAAISRGTTESSVQGFVLFGLSEEALKCLDHLFSGEELQELYRDHNFRDCGRRPSFVRNRVEVVISVQGGDIMTIDAVTYSALVYNLSDRDGHWDINRFVRSKTFTELSGAGQGSFWMEEETRLASTMGMTLVLSGDALCSAVLQKDKEKLLELLENGHDVNAPCTYHGSTLAAAAFTGREDLVELLIRHGANINAAGGEYHTPLIAATTQGHEECARALVKAGADVLAHGGKYISAIYQAVDFGDTHLAKMLLEKGAWLTKDYRELLDLAAERGNRGITRMIEDYDVRKLYLLPPPGPKISKVSDSKSSERMEEGSQSDTDFESGVTRRGSSDKLERRRSSPSALAVVRAVGLQALYLKGQRGKWTGIKGVKVLRAAFEVGMSESILDTIRPHLSKYQDLVDFLGTALVEYEQEQEDQGPSRRVLPSGSQGELSSSSRRRGEGQGRISRSRNDQEYSETSISSRGVRYVNDDSMDDVFCLTCDGRGGRRGTGRNCTNCRGAGTFPTGSGNRLTKCKSCNGSGLIFAQRDRCRACGGVNPAGYREPSIDRRTMISDDPPPPYSSTASVPYSPASNRRR